jgi:hypothetical protein
MGPLPTLRNIMSTSLFICQILRKLLKMPSQVEATLIPLNLYIIAFSVLLQLLLPFSYWVVCFFCPQDLFIFIPS